MVWTPFPHRKYLVRTSAAAINRIRSAQVPAKLCLEALDAALTNFPLEQACIRSAMDAAIELNERLAILAANETLRDQPAAFQESSNEDLKPDVTPIIYWTSRLLAHKAHEIACWRYLLLVCELADLSDLRPLYEASLADAQSFEDWLRRAFETLAVNQLEMDGVLSAGSRSGNAISA